MSRRLVSENLNYHESIRRRHRTEIERGRIDKASEKAIEQRVIDNARTDRVLQRGKCGVGGGKIQW